ncbi:MAG: hypothetical protein ACFHVJ_06950 [Aestuariibacter sp.]
MLNRQTLFILFTALVLLGLAYVATLVNHNPVSLIFAAAMILVLTVLNHLAQTKRPPRSKQLQLPLTSE